MRRIVAVLLAFLSVSAVANVVHVYEKTLAGCGQRGYERDFRQRRRGRTAVKNKLLRSIELYCRALCGGCVWRWMEPREPSGGAAAVSTSRLFVKNGGKLQPEFFYMGCGDFGIMSADLKQVSRQTSTKENS